MNFFSLMYTMTYLKLQNRIKAVKSENSQFFIIIILQFNNVKKKKEYP